MALSMNLFLSSVKNSLVPSTEQLSMAIISYGTEVFFKIDSIHWPTSLRELYVTMTIVTLGRLSVGFIPNIFLSVSIFSTKDYWIMVIAEG